MDLKKISRFETFFVNRFENDLFIQKIVADMKNISWFEKELSIWKPFVDLGNKYCEWPFSATVLLWKTTTSRSHMEYKAFIKASGMNNIHAGVFSSCCFWRLVSSFFWGIVNTCINFSLHESFSQIWRKRVANRYYLWEVYLVFYLQIFSLMCQSESLFWKTAVQKAGWVFVYFCGGHKNIFRLQFRSSFKVGKRNTIYKS